jgi:hypothetical protein
MVDRLVPSGWRSQLRDPMITRTRSDDHQNVDRLAGIVLDCGMLPIGTCKPDVSPTNPGGEPVYRVLLTQCRPAEVGVAGTVGSTTDGG